MRSHRKSRRLVMAAALILAAVPAAAQWLKQPTAAVPRRSDGSADLSAPAPTLPDGRIDISGLWMPNPTYIGNIARDLPSVPFQPWSETLYKHRRETESKDDPTGKCVVGGVPRSDAVPYPFKIFTQPTTTVILYEAVHSYRQIFTDGRALPADPNPAWFGYSIGTWNGPEFVVTTTGFNDDVWLDNFGHPAKGTLRVTERFRRRDFGHMDVAITIDDPATYTAPWTITLPLTLMPDTELLEYMCNENNRDLEHLVGK